MNTHAEFEVWHKDFIGSNSADPDNKAYKCVLEIIDRSTGIADFYRSRSGAEDVEKEIRARLGLFRGKVHERNLRLLRRFFLRRYAAGLILQVDGILVRHCGASRLWLTKDYPMPRIGLAQVLGLGVVLGATGVFNGLQDIANTPQLWFRFVVLIGFLALVWGLLYLHVRDRIGRPAKRVRTRTWGLFAIGMTWPAFAFFGEWWAGKVVGWTFYPWRAVLVNAAALVFALLSQFFFSKDATIGDPL